MNIKELRKLHPAPFALSVLMRALELNPDEPDLATAIEEYAAEMKKRPTRCDFNIVMHSSANRLAVSKVSSETEKYQPIYRLLAVQKMNGKLEQKAVDNIMAIRGEHIEIYPAKYFDLKGYINNFFEINNDICIVGIDVSPAIPKVELTLKEEIMATLTKNVLAHYMEYAFRQENLEQEIARLKKILEEKDDAKLQHRLDLALKKQKTVVPFMDFLLSQPIVFYDSIVKKQYSFLREEGRPIQEYLKQAAKKQAEAIGIKQLEFTIVQAEVHDLT